MSPPYVTTVTYNVTPIPGRAWAYRPNVIDALKPVMVLKVKQGFQGSEQPTICVK